LCPQRGCLCLKINTSRPPSRWASGQRTQCPCSDPRRTEGTQVPSSLCLSREASRRQPWPQAQVCRALRSKQRHCQPSTENQVSRAVRAPGANHRTSRPCLPSPRTTSRIQDTSYPFMSQTCSHSAHSCPHCLPPAGKASACRWELLSLWSTALCPPCSLSKLGHSRCRDSVPGDHAAGMSPAPHLAPLTGPAEDLLSPLRARAQRPSLCGPESPHRETGEAVGWLGLGAAPSPDLPPFSPLHRGHAHLGSEDTRVTAGHSDSSEGLSQGTGLLGRKRNS
jgi:hypothetical protein